MDTEELARIAFEAHRDYLSGDRPWSDVRAPERRLWEATAEAVADAVLEDVRD